MSSTIGPADTAPSSGCDLGIETKFLPEKAQSDFGMYQGDPSLALCSVIDIRSYERAETEKVKDVIKGILLDMGLEEIYLELHQESFKFQFSSKKAKTEFKSEGDIAELNSIMKAMFFDERFDFVCIVEKQKYLLIRFVNKESREAFEEEYEGKVYLAVPLKFYRRMYMIEAKTPFLYQNDEEIVALNKDIRPYGFGVRVTKKGTSLMLVKIEKDRDKLPYNRDSQVFEKKQLKLSRKTKKN